MRVLHFLDSLGRGGAEAQALDICRNAAAFDLAVTIATARGGALEPEFLSSGAEFYRFSRKFPVDLYLASQLRSLIREKDFDIVHGYQPVDGLHLYLAARGLKRVKRVLSFQGYVQDRRNRVASRFLAPRMDANIVVSNGLREWLAENVRLDASGFNLIYNGADPERLAPTGRSLKRELELASDTRLIGMIGNFYRDPRKDQLTICRALPAVFAEHANVHCVFAGRIEPGAEDKMADCLNFCLENEIVDRVHFLGGRDDVPDILAELELFIFSSLHEGMPLAVAEAMLAGVPAILTDIPAHLEISAGGKFARLFPTSDHVRLAAEVIAALRDREGSRELSEAAREHAERNFSITAHLKALGLLYGSLIA
jgi:glycosyltransferase involved in cell wall biosynthesis